MKKMNLQILVIFLALSNNNNVSACGKTFDTIFQMISDTNVNISADILLNGDTNDSNENCLWSFWSSWSTSDCSDPSKNCNLAQFRTRTIINTGSSSKGKEKICQGQDKSYKNVCCISDTSREEKLFHATFEGHNDIVKFLLEGTFVDTRYTQIM